MSLIDDDRPKVAGDLFEFSKHAVDQAILRGIGVQEVREAVGTAVLIEDYPETSMVRAASCWASRRQGDPSIFSPAIHLAL